MSISTARRVYNAITENLIRTNYDLLDRMPAGTSSEEIRHCLTGIEHSLDILSAPAANVAPMMEFIENYDTLVNHVSMDIQFPDGSSAVATYRSCETTGFTWARATFYTANGNVIGILEDFHRHCSNLSSRQA